MAVYFFDTSALVKYYHTEPGGPEVVALIEGPGNSILISHLTYVEWHSVFARHTRTGVISADEFRVLRSRFYADLQGLCRHPLLPHRPPGKSLRHPS